MSAQDQPRGVYLLACGECGLPLGRKSGVEGEPGRCVCPRCQWWIEWVWVVEPGRTLPIIDFTKWPVPTKGVLGGDRS